MMKPNVVLIICDGLRPKDLSLYGYDVETDKYLKKIASECFIFENNFTASNASDSSVTSLFSGQLPETTGFIHQHPFMRKEELDKLRKNKFWLPLYLQKLGYYTISGTPLHLWFKKGFDFYMTKESRGQNKFLNKPLVKRLLLALPNWIYTLGKKLIKSRASPQFYSSKEVIRLAMNKIDESEKPFFVFMHLVDTHYPYPAVKAPGITRGKNLEMILKELKHNAQKEYVKKRFSDIGVNSIGQITEMRDDSIKEVDKNLHEFYIFLRSRNLWDNTIFIILSDHGDSFGEHLNYLCRGGLHKNIIHTPLIAHFPNMGGGKVSGHTQSTDVASTILEILGEKGYSLDGKSLVKLAKTGKNLRREIRVVDSYCDKRYAIINERNKKIVTEKGGRCMLCGGEHHEKREEIYDLEKDAEKLEV
jgi:arylsulfatase A-like enzyme